MNYKRLGFNVREKDVKVNDIVKHSTILDYFQDIAGMQANDMHIGYQDVKDSYLWILLYIRFDVVSRLPHFGEEVDVITWPKPKGKLEYEREYEIRSKDNELLITGISNWCLIDSKTRMIKRAELDYEGEMYPNTNYEAKSPRKLGLELGDVIDEYNYKVLMTDLDHNMHMNNARYLDIIYNMGNASDYKKLEIAYLHEAKLNEIINVKHFKDDIYDCYIGYVNGEKCFEVKIIYDEV